jgi:Flp pilus assembly protein TadG
MLRPRRNEEGAVAVIVVLSLVALLGMIVLTVDVGQLLFKRRAMVNASDAAALAAAQTCAGLDDSDVPEVMADTFALDNVGNAITAAPNITELVGCDGPAFGHVTVEYGVNQDLFFAGVLQRSGAGGHGSDRRLGSSTCRQPGSDRRLHR